MTTATNKTAFYRVNELKSERACTRENIEAKTVNRHMGDFENMSDAVAKFDEIGGSEVAAQLLFIDEENKICNEIACNY